MHAREQFLAILNSGPILAPDALVVLCGEDSVPRIQFAIGKVQEFAHWAHLNKTEDFAPPVVLTGGRSEPPHLLSAKDLETKLLAAGLSPDRIILDNESQNTRGQAVNVVGLAKKHGWRRIMVVMSPYHSFRAFLTFLQAAKEAGIDKALEINVAPASHVPWWKAPEGTDATRIEILKSEMSKCLAYKDHVAAWEEGIEYLKYWELREEKRR